MTIRQTQHELTARGITLAKSPEGKLLVTPTSRLTPGLRAAVKEHKDALLDEVELARMQREWMATGETM